MNTTLKPPPRFVTNAWAWSYTLDKLRDKDMLDDAGNPRNYAAAAAIYKRVCAKYGEPDQAPKEPQATLTRADLLGLQSRAWVPMRGSFFLAASNDLDWRLTHTPNEDCWTLERYGYGTVDSFAIAEDIAAWLLEPAKVAA